MDIFLLLLASVMWSFVGTLVKTATSMFNSSMISFFRFFFGIIFLSAFILWRDRKLKISWKNKWIWIGALGKSGNYIFENIGLSMGSSYGNIMAVPFQSILMLFISIYFFKEKIKNIHWVGIALSIIGISLVSWNGVSLKAYLSSNVIITMLFAISGIASIMHTLSQKVLIDSMESGQMNLSIFIWCTFMTAVPAGFSGKWTGIVTTSGILAVLALGFITGISFFIYAKALKRIPFLVAVIVSNVSMLLNFLWSWLFFKENITPYILIGGSIFIAGVILLNTSTKTKKAISSQSEERVPA
jgi:drug/metabolite transporter (DMT)-like permease